MTRLIVSVEARADIERAVAWLREISPELPERFDAELEALLSAILDHPEMYPAVYRRFRRALLRRFPYSVFYVVERSDVLVTAVVHQSRDEAVWKRR